MGKLVIKRKAELLNSMRKIELYVDNKKIASIENGGRKEFELEPGNYRLKARIDWCGSKVENITMGEDEVKYVELSGYKYSNIIIPVFFIIAFPGLIISYFSDFNFSSIAPFIFLPGVLYLLYHISFGRNQYLRLKLFQEKSF